MDPPHSFGRLTLGKNSRRFILWSTLVMFGTAFWLNQFDSLSSFQDASLRPMTFDVPEFKHAASAQVDRVISAPMPAAAPASKVSGEETANLVHESSVQRNGESATGSDHSEQVLSREDGINVVDKQQEQKPSVQRVERVENIVVEAKSVSAAANVERSLVGPQSSIAENVVVENKVVSEAGSADGVASAASQQLGGVVEKVVEHVVPPEKREYAAPMEVVKRELIPPLGSQTELDERAQQMKRLREMLNFSNRTAINFMHFHKTGGVSFKTSLHRFYHTKFKPSGARVLVRDACYQREGAQARVDQPSFMMWRCDWTPLWAKTEDKRNEFDLLIGHQYWVGGAEQLLNKRDMRTFTVMRHPFDRKVSFFYHFFVREQRRVESSVSYEEIRDFLLYDKVSKECRGAALGGDLGPNYMAGRLLSDGTIGFVGNSSYRHYAVEAWRKGDVAEQSLKLVRDYMFVGLQSESGASKCMLRKVVEAFNAAHGIDNIGTEKIDSSAKVLNSGSYALTAADIWGRFTAEEKALFDRKERVDLTIYEEGERLFHKHARLFECYHLVKKPRDR